MSGLLLSVLLIVPALLINTGFAQYYGKPLGSFSYSDGTSGDVYVADDRRLLVSNFKNENRGCATFMAGPPKGRRSSENNEGIMLPVTVVRRRSKRSNQLFPAFPDLGAVNSRAMGWPFEFGHLKLAASEEDSSEHTLGRASSQNPLQVAVDVGSKISPTFEPGDPTRISIEPLSDSPVHRPLSDRKTTEASTTAPTTSVPVDKTEGHPASQESNSSSPLSTTTPDSASELSNINSASTIATWSPTASPFRRRTFTFGKRTTPIKTASPTLTVPIRTLQPFTPRAVSRTTKVSPTTGTQTANTVSYTATATADSRESTSSTPFKENVPIITFGTRRITTAPERANGTDTSGEGLGLAQEIPLTSNTGVGQSFSGSAEEHALKPFTLTFANRSRIRNPDTVLLTAVKGDSKEEILEFGSGSGSDSSGEDVWEELPTDDVSTAESSTASSTVILFGSDLTEDEQEIQIESEERLTSASTIVRLGNETDSSELGEEEGSGLELSEDDESSEITSSEITSSEITAESESERSENFISESEQFSPEEKSSNSASESKSKEKSSIASKEKSSIASNEKSSIAAKEKSSTASKEKSSIAAKEKSSFVSKEVLEGRRESFEFGNRESKQSRERNSEDTRRRPVSKETFHNERFFANIQKRIPTSSERLKWPNGEPPDFVDGKGVVHVHFGSGTNDKVTFSPIRYVSSITDVPSRESGFVASGKSKGPLTFELGDSPEETSDSQESSTEVHDPILRGLPRIKPIESSGGELSFGQDFDLPQSDGDTLLSLDLPQEYSVADFEWVGVYDHCTEVRKGFVSISEDFEAPRVVTTRGISGWIYGVNSSDIQLLNCNTILIRNFTYNGADKEDAYFYVGIGDFPNHILQKVKALVSEKGNRPLESVQGEDIEILLPEGWRIFDIDWISVYNPDQNISYGHSLIPSAWVPPCDDLL